MFGPGCNQTCSCQRGDCDNSVNSTGVCKQFSCHTGYIGSNCSTRLPACKLDSHLSCVGNADCFNLNGVDTCVCEPGYTGNGNTSCQAINPCEGHLSHGCHSNASCVYLGPGKHKCKCKQGYRGDGRFCVVDNPCTSSNGGCPKNTSACNFLGPGKSNCSCLYGFSNFKDGQGCSLIDMCNDGKRGGCDIYANCVMVKPGDKRCICKKGFRGNGTVCYGNIIERARQLHRSGPFRGSLTFVNIIFGHTLARPLVDTGPFTAFVPIDSAINMLSTLQKSQLLSNNDFAAHIVRLHLIAADLDSVALKKLGKLTTLQGNGATITDENGTLSYSLDGLQDKAKVIASDFLAGNGIIHIIDKLLWFPGNYSQTENLTVLQIIEQRDEFRQFSAFLQLTELDSYIQGLQGSVTFFVPDDHFVQFDNLTTMYLTKTDKGKEKLRSILKTHIVTKKIDITDLMSISRVMSVEGESNTVQRKSNGSIIIGKKSQITEANILAKDGLIHKINNVLIPDFVKPLIPNYSYNTTYTSTKGVCYRCDTMQSFPNKGCPSGYIPSGGFISCRYVLTTFLGQFSFAGCRVKNCLKKIPECSFGYYGSSCKPCPGPLEKSCNLRGKCDDGIKGSGLCSCHASFSGVACEMCARSSQFGSNCNSTCTCVHGSCDNGVQGNGTCKPNTCKNGFHGDNCDLTDKSCVNAPAVRCHYHAHCINDNGQDKCKCNAGYEGSGLVCDEINPCTKPNRGGCHKDASCIKTGPGTNNCTCDSGFDGDGTLCIAHDPCKQGAQYNCHSNAECKFLGPGQSTCQCKPGFTGNGRSCSEINNCLVNNGGCSKKAKCDRVGPGNSTCTCSHGYIGNGFSCLGTLTAILRQESRFTSMFDLVKKAHMEYYLSMANRNFTLFVPSSSAIASMSVNDSQYWTSSPHRLKYLIENHIVNYTIYKRDFKNNSALVTIGGQTLNVIVKDLIILNGQTSVTILNFVGANGVIHYINKVLIPPRPPAIYLPVISQVLASIQELSNFYSVLQTHTNVKASLDKCTGCTVFAPVNDVFNDSMTSNALKYHVITKYIHSDDFFIGQEFPTLLDENNYKVRLTKSVSEKNEVNGIMFYKTPIKAKHSIIYKLSGVLRIPGKRKCDVSRTIFGVTLCRFCVLTNNCPTGWTKVRTQSCTFWLVFRGCQAVCRKTVVTRKCCDGFWGQDCQACPGNVTSACFGNGKCLDGISGSGHCNCSSNFTGTACEKCLPNRYGKDCASKCDCVNGRCHEGLNGDGTCKCRHGYQGSRCDDNTDPSRCRPAICSANATCRNMSGSFRCDCDVGYTGNGSYCRVIHICDKNNGGCHKNAVCIPNPTNPSLASCSCKKKYSGDGQYCAAIDRCQINNGGCHENATCASTGPDVRKCYCKVGYHGNGLICRPDDPCTVNNGGCSWRATCKRTGPGQRKCTCGAKYYGNGKICIGSSMEVLKTDPELSKVNDLFKKYRINKLLESNCKANVLAPTNQALAKILNSEKRKRRSVPLSPTVEQYLRYHIIGCIRFNYFTFKTGGKFISLLGAPIWISNSEQNSSQVVFRDAQGNTANITESFESENGYVFKLDAVLSPPPDFLQLGNTAHSLTKVAQDLGFTTAAGLIKNANFENVVSNPYGRPYLVFLTTNQGIDKLPSDFKARLTNPANVGELSEYLKYHVVHNVPENLTSDFFVRSGGGVQFRTLQGQSLFISCKGGKGDLYVNGISRIVKRDIQFTGGVAFGVDDALIPLGLGGNCDRIVHEKSTSPCGNCLSTEGCAHDSTIVGTTNHNCTYGDGFLGCQHICMKRKVVHKCCQNFYGPDCRACPGGIGMSCNRRGRCDDGLTGIGTCDCYHGYNGTACEKCTANISCQVSSPCADNNGGCHVFATCSNSTGHVKCTCKPGYEGDGFYCQMHDPCTLGNGDCGINATCYFEGPSKKRCQCKQGFYRTIDGCKAFVLSSPCSINHGSCSDHAYCREINGSAICTCWDSYYGDGYACHGNIIQV